MAITINGSGTITGVSAGGLPDGSITADDLASSGTFPAWDGSALTGISAGKVLQVVQDKYSTDTQNSSGTEFATGLSADITPSSTSSKILILVSQNAGGSCGSSSNNLDYHIRIKRNGTVYHAIKCRYDNITNMMIAGISHSLTYLDSPATTSQVTYSVHMQEGNSSSKFLQAQYSNADSTIMLLEIEG